jgi:hypothetical protein
MRLSATAKAAKDFGLASAACGHTPTATASTSSLKPSRWTDASLSASLPKKPNNQFGHSNGWRVKARQPFFSRSSRNRQSLPRLLPFTVMPTLRKEAVVKDHHQTVARPDQATLEKLVALGQCADDDARLGEMLASLKGSIYVCSIQPFQEFGWSREMSWADASAVVKAIVRVEAARLTHSGGSASAVKNAFRTMEDRDRVAAMELAAWIVDHTDNDYIPFPMRKIRYAFESIKLKATCWGQCREMLDRWNADEWARQQRVAEEMANQKPEGEHRRQIQSAVAARIRAEQAEVQHAEALAREKLLAELRALPAKERLEHIAWDDSRALTYYPSDLADCTVEDIEQLDPVTRARFTAKLRERKKGPWQKLTKKLRLEPVSTKN